MCWFFFLQQYENEFFSKVLDKLNSAKLRKNLLCTFSLPKNTFVILIMEAVFYCEKDIVVVFNTSQLDLL